MHHIDMLEMPQTYVKTALPKHNHFLSISKYLLFLYWYNYMQQGTVQWAFFNIKTRSLILDIC